MNKKIKHTSVSYTLPAAADALLGLHCKIPLLVAAIFMLLCSQVSFAQNNITAQIEKSLNNYTIQGISEKLYVHTDKSFYMTGEILWFKIYYTDAVSNKPIDVSKVAYIEVIDSANQPVLQAKAGLNKGEGTGSLFLSQSIISGNYKLRAYTRWMKNDAADFFFEKNITIINLNKFKAVGNKSMPQKFDIQFFPEGGHIVDGITSKIAFKGTDEYGKGISFAGYLLDGADTVLKFAPAYAGMGHFTFAPQQGHHYIAHIDVNNAAPIKKELPPVLSKGATMSLSESDAGSMTLTVSTNDVTHQAFHLVAHTRSVVKIIRSATVQNGKAIFTFNASSLGDGVSHLTIFNDGGIPVCERLYFKRPEKELGLFVHTTNPSYGKREKVNVTLSSALQLADSASISMSVYRIDSLQSPPSTNNSILFYLYLTSDLKGMVENAGYYFNNTKEAKAAADNLMLTQGWRRFTWKNVLADNNRRSFQYAPEVKGHIITGQVINSLTGQPQSNITTYVGAPSSITQFGVGVSDENGNVKFEINNFFGSTTFIAQQNSATQDSIYRFRVHSPYSDSYSSTAVPTFVKPVHYPRTLLQQSMSTQVQNIYASEKMSQVSYPYFTDTAAFYEFPDFSYKLDDYTRFTSMEEVLREYVIMVNVRRRKGEVELPVFDPETKVFLSGQPLNLLDGVPVFDFKTFFEFDPLKVSSLDVITQRYIYRSVIFNGILNWKTYKPSVSNYTLPSNAVVLDYDGLLAEREFYTPAYNTPETIASRVPDYRTLLQWNPHIKIKAATGKALQFYSSDLAGTYAVVVEGLSGEGLAGSAVITFEVR